MAKEYIEREAILSHLEETKEGLSTLAFKWVIDALIECYKTFPEADAVEVKHGEWRLETDEEMSNPMFKLVVCSVCSEKANHIYKFCPNCGAKMDLKEGAEK